MKNLLNEIKAMNRIAGTQLTKEQEIAIIRERLEQLNELEFGTQKAFDAYQKQHDMRGSTQVTVAGKKMSVSQAAKQSKDPAINKIKGTSIFGKKPDTTNIKKGHEIDFYDGYHNKTKGKVLSTTGDMLNVFHTASGEVYRVPKSNIIKVKSPSTSVGTPKFKSKDIEKGHQITFYDEKDNRLVKANVDSIKGDKIKATHHTTSGFDDKQKYNIDLSKVLKVSKKK